MAEDKISKHSVTFVDTTSGKSTRNTWSSWYLVPSSKPMIALPEVNTNYVDIPGANGSLDLSEILSGGPSYKNREGSFECFLMHTGLSSSEGEELGYSNFTKGAAENKVTSIANFLHGRYLKMMLEDDPDWYYMGRFSVSDVKAGSSMTSLTINYHLDPFKYKKAAVSSMWLWDPCHFKAGANKYYENTTDPYVSDTQQGTYIKDWGKAQEINSEDTYLNLNELGNTSLLYPVEVVIEATAPATVKIHGISIDLTEGTNTNVMFVLRPNDDDWVFNKTNSADTCKVSFNFRPRSL